MSLTRVTITNRLPAAQGFYGLDGAAGVDPEGIPGADPLYVNPGQTRTLYLDREQLRIAGFLAPNVSITEDPLRPGAADTGPTTGAPHAASDDGTRAAGDGALVPPRDNTAGGGSDALVIEDTYESLTDEQLRAFITDRDGKAPHHMLGRPKLLALAREEVNDGESI